MADTPEEVAVGVPGTVMATGTINVREEMARPRRDDRATLPSRGRPEDPALATPFSDPILQQAPPPAAGFDALGDSNGSIPPNTSGAAGPTHLMVALNTQVRFQQKNGTPVGTVPLNGFWSTVNGGSGAEDPRVVFDPLGRKWVTVAVDDTGNTATAGLLVGVSRTADPTGSWQLFKISTSPYWADRPTVGFNKNWVVVQANLYSGGGFVGSRVYAIDRPGLFQDSPPPTLTFRSINLAGLAVVPAASYGTAIDPLDQPDELYLLDAWNPGAGALRLHKLVGPVGSETIPPPAAVAPSAPVPWSDGPGALNFAPQAPGCTAACNPDCRIQTGDSRIQSVAYRNGYLWAAHTVFFPLTPGPSRSSVQWWRIDPFLASVRDRGLVDDPTGARLFAYPSIAVNKNDDVLLGYSRFQGTEFAGASYSFRTAIDPDGTMQAERRLRNGEACYYKDFTLGKNEWGAYSATVVDPDDETLWTVQEYASLPSGGFDRWGTYWGQVDPRPRVVISDAQVAEDVVPRTTLLVFDVSLMTFDLAQPFPTSQTVTVDWSTQPGSATAGVDYVTAAGTLTFAPGETAKTVTVLVNSDTVAEPNETLFVNLANPVNATLGDAQGQGTILDLPLPLMSISDVEVVEGNPPTTYTNANFRVRLSHPSSATVSALWSTKNGTATSPSDFLAFTNVPVTFNPNEVEQTLTVPIVADSTPEGDEVFTVELTSPSGATLLKPIGTGVILDDDALVSNPPVRALVVLADGTSTAGRNRLQWVNPDVTGAQGIRINFTTAPTPCPGLATDGIVIDEPFLGAGQAQSYTHDNLPYVDHCYAVWVWYGGSTWSVTPALTATGRPFDATGQVKWKYFTGATNVAVPTVGRDVVIQPSNQGNLLHGMTRGRLGGMWPTPWAPYRLGSPAQARSPIVPLTGAFVGSVAFVSTLDGRIRAIRTDTGVANWTTLLPEGKVTAAPAGIFKPHGAYDYVLVGTNSGTGDHFYALDPYSGAVIDSFPGPSDGAISLGPVLAMASVDYDARRVYFTSRRPGGTGPSLWCLDLGPSSDALRLRWSRDLGADVDASPVLRGGKVYVGDNSSTVWSIPADTGVGGYSLPVGTSPIKNFLFPDRYSGDLYGANTTQVVGLVDTSSALVLKWPPLTLADPSTPLLQPGSTKLYVGVSSYSGNGASLVRIDTSTGNVAGSVALEPPPSQIVGPPSLDIGLLPDPNLIYVGSEKGVLYAVEASF